MQIYAMCASVCVCVSRLCFVKRCLGKELQIVLTSFYTVLLRVRVEPSYRFWHRLRNRCI